MSGQTQGKKTGKKGDSAYKKDDAKKDKKTKKPKK